MKEILTMEDITLNLTEEDLKNLKQIGFGSDGAIYLYKNQYLIKLYHQSVKEILFANTNDDNIKIYERKNKKDWQNLYNNTLTYYSYNPKNKEYILLIPKDGLQKVIEKSGDLQYTSLPKGIVYLNGHFAGSILERKRGIEIHRLSGMPLSYKKKIYLNILKSLAELYKHNIYHIDLHNSPYVEKIVNFPSCSLLSHGHSHILVNPVTCKTNIIDLDGKSTIYTENSPIIETAKEIKIDFQKMSLNNFSILALEFLLKIEYQEDNQEYLYQELEQKGIPFSMQEKLVEREIEDLEYFYELIRILKK